MLSHALQAANVQQKTIFINLSLRASNYSGVCGMEGIWHRKVDRKHHFRFWRRWWSTLPLQGPRRWLLWQLRRRKSVRSYLTAHWLLWQLRRKKSVRSCLTARWLLWLQRNRPTVMAASSWDSLYRVAKYMDHLWAAWRHNRKIEGHRSNIINLEPLGLMTCRLANMLRNNKKNEMYWFHFTNYNTVNSLIL